MRKEILIRRATIADIEPMRALERRAAQLFLSIGYDFCAAGPVRDKEEHEKTLRRGITFYAESENGAPAGFAMFEPMDSEAHLIEIDVDPVFQRQGLAPRLIAAGETWALAKGFDGMTLTTYRDVPWNAPFYRRIGFVDLEPGPERKELRETIGREADWGFAFKPRIAMRKQLL